jgi:hypothetical protein
MAQEFIASEVLVLEANTGTTVAKIWTKLVCLTEKSFSGTTAAVDIVTDCNEDFSSPQPGKKSWSMAYSGYANKSPAANEGSYETVYELWDMKTVTEFRIRNADNSYYREGRGFISDVSEPSSAGDYLQFSGTITGNGAVITSPAS